MASAGRRETADLASLRESLGSLNEAIAASKNLLKSALSLGSSLRRALEESATKLLCESVATFAEELGESLDTCHSMATEALQQVADWMNVPGNAVFDSYPIQSPQRLNCKETVPMDSSKHWSELDALLKEDADLCCPITLKLFVDPVLAPDSVVYERTVLETALNKCMVSPMTGAPMEAVHKPADEHRARALAFRQASLEKLLRFAEEIVSQEAPVAVVALQRVDAYINALKRDAPSEALVRAASVWSAMHRQQSSNSTSANTSEFKLCSPRDESMWADVVKNASTRRPKTKLTTATSTNLQHRLELLLASDESVRALARSLYYRFGGSLDSFPEVEKFLGDRFGFPSNLFPFLEMHLTQVAPASGGDKDSKVEAEDWMRAFAMWLHTVQARIGHALSRKQFVRKSEGVHADKLKSIYFQGAVLGEGAFGVVSVMLHKGLGVERVVKTINKAQLSAEEASLQGEVNLLKSLDHVHVVRIYETFSTEDALHIVMDYAEGGDLKSHIVAARSADKLLPERWVCEVVDQMASALDYVHWKEVVHCDLKPANAMLLRRVDPFEEQSSAPHIVLVDFGLSELFEKKGEGAARVKGTPLYLSPEGFEGQLTAKSDMWALGVIVFELLKGERPFQEKNPFLLWSRITRSQPHLGGLNDLAQQVVLKLLAKDPADRPSAPQCRRMDWFKNSAHCQEVKELSGEANVALQSLGFQSYFHRTAMMCIASELSLKDRPDILRIFSYIDDTRAGRITLEQLRKVMVLIKRQEDSNALFQLFDMDRNGYISYTEFVAAVLRIDSYLSERLIEEAFKLLDRGCKGFISKRDLQMLLSDDGDSSVECFPDGQIIDEVLETVGTNGGITLSDFRKDLTSMAQQPETICEFPMLVIAMEDFLKMSSIQPYWQLRATGRLLRPAEGAAIHYITWQWLSASHPDPDGRQLSRLQAYFHTLMEPNGTSKVLTKESCEALAHGTVNRFVPQDAVAQLSKTLRFPSNHTQSFDSVYADHVKEGYVWIDYCSMPELTSSLTADECVHVQRDRFLAHSSTPRYIRHATYFYMCALKGIHMDDAKDFNSWRHGGWCRAQELANFLSPKYTPPILITESPKASVLDIFDYWMLRAMRPSYSVFNGRFPCCERGHVLVVAGGRTWFTPCSKHLMEDVIQSLYNDKILALKDDGHDSLYRGYKVAESAIFSGASFDHSGTAYPLGESVQEFLERMLLPADPTALDSNGACALKWAAYMGYGSMMVKLLEARCPADMPDNNGVTPLHAAVISCDALGATTVLIEEGCLDSSAINSRTYGLQASALDRAVRNGLPDVAQLLMDNKARADHCQTDGHTPLNTAALMGHVDVCRVLLDVRVDINFQGPMTGEGALHCAAQELAPFGRDQSERMKVVELLVDHRIDVDLKDIQGRTARAMAIQDNNMQFPKVLESCLAALQCPSSKISRERAPVAQDFSLSDEMHRKAELQKKIKKLFSEHLKVTGGSIPIYDCATMLTTLAGQADCNGLQAFLCRMQECKEGTIDLHAFVDWVFETACDDKVDNWVRCLVAPISGTQ